MLTNVTVAGYGRDGLSELVRPSGWPLLDGRDDRRGSPLAFSGIRSGSFSPF